MSVARASVFAPFSVRSFRFQWPADLFASWAFEMEVLILGWYVLVESDSVLLLVVFGALQYVGSIVSPLFGVAGDRIGYRRLFLITRSIYACLAILLGVVAALGVMNPLIVLVVAGISGMIKPSDIMMRFALIAHTLPPQQLISALGVSRVTSDSARIAGALAGVGVVSVPANGRTGRCASPSTAGRARRRSGCTWARWGRSGCASTTMPACRRRPMRWRTTR